MPVKGETMKPGDKVWIGVNVGLVMPDGTAWHTDLRGVPLKGSFDTTYILDVPHLAEIARYLAQHPETVDALEERLDRCHIIGSGEETENSKLAYGFLDAMRGETDHDER